MKDGAFARSLSVTVVAILVACCIVAICFLVPRRPGMEEAGVFNAAYTFAYYGKMSFPVYGLDFISSFGIHPHLHYAILGLLIRWGLSLYTAEAVIISVISLIAIAAILAARFPDTITLGFLLGLYGTIVMAVMYLPDHAVGVRPELHVSIAWLAGLVAIESARLNRWNLPRLCVGVLLICYAAAMQNYALLAPAGLLIYAVPLFRSAPRREAFQKLAAACAVMMVVAIPFLLWYAIPNWTMIRTNIDWGTTHSVPLASKLAEYFKIYDAQLPLYRRDLFSSAFAIGPLVAAVSLRIPLFAATLALLLASRQTRAMAFAFLPVPLLVIATLPKAHYFISEQAIFLSAFWAAVLTAVARFNSAPLLPGILCTAAVIVGSPVMQAIPSWRRPPLHEMDIARAAARQVIGPDARVASRHLGWYITGGEEWYRVEKDLTEPARLEFFDPRAYAAQFDAIADYSVFSWQTQSGVTPAWMYASGAIQLAGVYLPQRMPNLGFALFQARRQGPVACYYPMGEQWQRFQQDDSGPLTLILASGPREHPSDPFQSLKYVPNFLDLPGDPPASAISAYITRREAYLSAMRALPANLHVIDTISGTSKTVDPYEMVRSSQANDRPIRFLRSPQETAISKFLDQPGHVTARADECASSAPDELRPERPLSSGFYAEGFEAANVFGDSGRPWGSEKLGPKTAVVSFIGADFGADQPAEVRAIALKHTQDPDSSIRSAVLMSSPDSYAWEPKVELLLNKDGGIHRYCFPATGARRYWKLMAADNPQVNHAWQIVMLRLFGNH